MGDPSGGVPDVRSRAYRHGNAGYRHLQRRPSDTTYTRHLNEKYYELTDHLGNVRAVLGDRKLTATPGAGNYYADIRSYSHPYPFGMPQPGRTWDNSLAYRYGFNGMEGDPEVSGQGNHFTTYFRQYDPRLGRWWSNDPITHPWESPYAAMSNNPAALIDPLGAATSNPSPQSTPLEPGTDVTSPGKGPKTPSGGGDLNPFKPGGWKRIAQRLSEAIRQRVQRRRMEAATRNVQLLSAHAPAIHDPYPRTFSASQVYCGPSGTTSAITMPVPVEIEPAMMSAHAAEPMQQQSMSSYVGPLYLCLHNPPAADNSNSADVIGSRIGGFFYDMAEGLWIGVQMMGQDIAGRFQGLPPGMGAYTRPVYKFNGELATNGERFGGSISLLTAIAGGPILKAAGTGLGRVFAPVASRLFGSTEVSIFSQAAAQVGDDFVRAGAAAEGAVGSATAGIDDLVPLCRAISPAELDDVLRFGDYGLSPSGGGKYFSLTEQGATDFTQSSINSGLNMTVTKIEIPRSFLNRGFRFFDPGKAGAGESIHFSDDVLMDLYPAIQRPTILSAPWVPTLSVP